MPEYLAPEIAEEGVSANTWNPEADFQPFVARPVIPTYEGVKSIQKYFPQFSGIPYKHQAFPAWFYHKTEEPRLARTAEQAKSLGAVWHGAPEFRWECAGEWQPKPFKVKFDAVKPGMGKSVVHGGVPAASPDQMIAAVVAAVMANMGKVQADQARPGVTQNALAADPDYVEFMAFKAWKSGRAGEAHDDAAALDRSKAPAETLLTGQLSPEEEKALIVQAAAERGIEVDTSLGLDAIKAQLEEIGGEG